jgi:hypothetical protein
MIMKKIKNHSVIILGLLFLFSFKKDNERPPSVTGYWKGAVGSIELELLQRPDGTVRLCKKTEGTWKLQGNKYTAVFSSPYSTISLSAPVFAPVTYIAGTIILADSTSNNAYAFYVAKQKRRKP